MLDSYLVSMGLTSESYIGICMPIVVWHPLKNLKQPQDTTAPLS